MASQRVLSGSFHELLVSAAQAEGFPLAGAVDIDLAAPFFDPHIKRYDAWLAAGYGGAMEYLKRGRDPRADPRLLLPGAQSVFVVAIPYPAQLAGNPDPQKGPRYARYLRRADYHRDIAARLETVMKKVAAQSPTEFKWKVCVDTSAVLERAWAAIAGLGWIGKNTLLIHPQYGSYLFIGEVLLTAKTDQAPRLFPNYCGNCTRCMTACPTQAIPAPGVLAANRCIAYWTLEKRGELPVSDDDRKAIGTWVAGCDICQEVCPFNLKVARAAEKSPVLDDRENGAISLDTWEELLKESEPEYRLRIKDSALSRVKPAQFRRNLAIAIANARPARLGEWAAQAREVETDPVVKAEWERALKAHRQE